MGREGNGAFGPRLETPPEKPLGGIAIRQGLDASISTNRPPFVMPEPGKARATRRRENAGRCEPGDLPANVKGISPDLGRGFPTACTEVVMAVSATSSVTLSANDRLVAGVFALLLGAFLVFGAGLANSAVLHDTAHDTRHSYGFPCH